MTGSKSGDIWSGREGTIGAPVITAFFYIQEVVYALCTDFCDSCH